MSATNKKRAVEGDGSGHMEDQDIDIRPTGELALMLQQNKNDTIAELETVLQKRLDKQASTLQTYFEKHTRHLKREPQKTSRTYHDLSLQLRLSLKTTKPSGK